MINGYYLFVVKKVRLLKYYFCWLGELNIVYGIICFFFSGIKLIDLKYRFKVLKSDIMFFLIFFFLLK